MIKEFNKLEYIVNKCPKLFVLFCNSTTISIWNMYDLFSLYISSLYWSKSLRFLLKNFYRFMHIFFSVLSLFMGFLKMILSFKIIKGIFLHYFFFFTFDAYLWIDQNISWIFSSIGSYFIYMGSYSIATLKIKKERSKPKLTGRYNKKKKGKHPPNAQQTLHVNIDIIV